MAYVKLNLLVHSETVCKSVLNNLISRVERLEQKGKNKRQPQGDQRSARRTPGNQRQPATVERTRKLKKMLKERKER